MIATSTSAGPRPLRFVVLLVATAGVSACITVLSRSMRAVMDVGGYCAEGGPYEIATPCPDGIPGLTIGSIWIGLLFAGLYVWAALPFGTAGLVGLAWPALFLALGWNFLEYGFDPPGAAGVAPAWIICGVVFVLMGGGPLLFALWGLRNAHKIRRSEEPDAGEAPGPGQRTFAGRRPHADPDEATVTAGASSRPSTRTGPGAGAAAATAATAASHGEPRDDSGRSPVGEPEGLVDALERLAALHRRGEIDDEEYRAAKQALLAEEGS